MIQILRNFSIALLSGFLLLGCSDLITTNIQHPNFLISTDSISFDTVRSASSTVTRNFRIINPNGYSIEIDKLYLGGKENTHFRLNVDGNIPPIKEHFSILPYDSIWVFVEATFPDYSVDSICFQTDSIIVETAVSTQRVKLVSWSQDVIYKSGQTNPGEEWKGTMPYYIKDSLVVPEGEVLVIKEGVKVYFHNEAFLKVFGGLEVDGTLESPVCFQGDRFENNIWGYDYENSPGQWGGIHVYPFSEGIHLNYAVIKNSVAGILVLGSTEISEVPTLTISNTIIKNNSYAGIASFGAHINCSNTFFTNNMADLAMYLKGSCNFNHVTFNNRYGPRDSGTLCFKNYLLADKVLYVGEFDELTFNNSIITGNQPDEITLDGYNETRIKVQLKNCLLKVESKSIIDQLKMEQVMLNVAPLLVTNETIHPMYLDTLSPAIDTADKTIALHFSTDMLGNSRLDDGQPDMGAIEFQK